MSLATKSPQAPIEAIDIFAGAIGTTATPESRRAHQSNVTSEGLDPAQFEYLNIHGVSREGAIGLQRANAEEQPWYSQAMRAVGQFGVNAVAAFGQGLADTFDLHSTYKTLKGEGDYESNLFGLSSREMAAWAEGYARRHQIYEKDPGSVNFLDTGWFFNQLAQTGTSLGMAGEALLTSYAIESLTAGLGSTAAGMKIAGLMKKVKTALKGADEIADLAKASKGFKSMSAGFIALNRYTESKMEARQTYDAIKKELSVLENPDGTRTYTDQEVENFAREGAAKDFHYNLAMIPLDILSYGAMTFNPISGTAEGMLERGLAKLGKMYGTSKLGKAAGWATVKGLAMQTEGIEEGFQDFASKEGIHYAKVLAGMDDGSNFAQRIGAEVGTSEFWNNYMGGVLGAPIVGGIMNVVNSTERGMQQKRVNQRMQKFLTTVGKIDNDVAQKIKKYQSEGKEYQAAALRNQFNVNYSLKALMMDAKSDRNEAFNAHVANRELLLAELEEGKTDGLVELGYPSSSEESRDVIKAELKKQISDAYKIQKIFNDVKGEYNSNFVPIVASQQFYLNGMVEDIPGIEAEIKEAREKDPQYNDLSAIGKIRYDGSIELGAIDMYRQDLLESIKYADDKDERQNKEDALDTLNKRIEELNEYEASIQKSDEYDSATKKKDTDILMSMHATLNKSLLDAMTNKIGNQSEIGILRKDLTLWRNDDYVARARDKVIRNALTEAELSDALEEIEDSKYKKMYDKFKAKVLGDSAAKAKEASVKTAAEKKEELEAAAAGDALLSEEFEVEGEYDTDDPEQAQYSMDDMMGIMSGDIPAPDEGDYHRTEPIVAMADFDLSPSITRSEIESLPQTRQDRIVAGVAGLLRRFNNPNGTFEEFIRDAIRRDGIEDTEKAFNLIAFGWEKNGRPRVDYETVKSNIFSSHMKDLVAIANEMVTEDSKPAELAKKNQAVSAGVANGTNPPGEVDPNGQPVWTYNTWVSSRADPKGQFTTFMVNTSVQETEAGFTVDRGFTGKSGMDNKWVNSSLLLGDKAKAGMKVSIRIPDDYGSIPVAIFDPITGNYDRFIPFNQWVAQTKVNGRPVLPTDQEYKDKIPMVIYPVDIDNGGKGIMQVHDVGWYQPVRFRQGSAEEMAKAIEATREIRDEVLESWNNGKGRNSVDSIVTAVTHTTFSALTLPEGEEITLQEANPESIIGVVGADSSDPKNVLVANKTRFENSSRRLMNRRKHDYEGQLVEMRKFGKDPDGKDKYVAFKVTRPKLAKEAKLTLLKALEYWATKKSPHAAKEKKAKDLRDKVMNLTGFNMDTLEGDYSFKQWIQHYIYFDTLSNKMAGAVSATDDIGKAIHKLATDTLPKGTPYIQAQSYRIVIGQAGVGDTGTVIYSKKDASYETKVLRDLEALKNTPVIIPEIKEGKKVETKYDSIFDWFELNYNLDNGVKNKRVVHIGEDFEVNIAAEDYHTYVRQNLKTNMRSMNIGTQEEPEWVTNVQPTVTYDTVNRLKNKENRSKSDTQVKKEVISKDPPPKASTAREIYGRLGKKTKSGNVKIVSWARLKQATRAIENNNVIATRIPNTTNHFGNPFSHDDRIVAANPGLIKTKTVREAVERYIEWILSPTTTIKPDQHKWIREQLIGGKLKSMPIFYYTELGEPSHATALDYLINTQTWGAAPAAAPVAKPATLFNPNDKTLKKGSVVTYNGKTYLFWNTNSSGKAQLINTDGTKFSGTPDINKLTVQGAFKTVMYRNKEYIVTDKGNIYSGTSGKLVYQGDDKTSQVQKQRILDEARAGLKVEAPKFEEGFVNHSGGADGADTAWDLIGQEFGVTSRHYWHGKQTPVGNIQITDEQLEEGWQHVLEANKTMKRKPDNYKSLLARNWFQVKGADAIYAVGKLATSSQVDGGTGWAVQMAIDNGKPVYLFNQEKGKWMQYDYDDRVFKETDTPVLTRNFAGIGTRNLTSVGRQGIRDAYEKTFNTKQGKREVEQNDELDDFLKSKNKFKNDKGPGIDHSPTILTDAQATKVEKSRTNLAGLTPKEQYELVNFLGEEIVPTIEANGGTITKEEVDKIVQDKFDELLAERRKEAGETVKKGANLLKKFPDRAGEINAVIADAQNTIDKINGVERSMNKLMDLAHKEAKKSANIKITRERLEDSIENDEDWDKPEDLTGDEPVERDKAYGQEALTENPENKVSKKLRRFFSRVIRRGPDGEAVQGVFNLPVYESRDNIVKFLQQVLANTPSDYNMMMGKLEVYAEATPWIREVIDRLKVADEATKNVFTVAMCNATNHMDFALVGYNKKTQTWYSKVKSTISSGAVENLVDSWSENFFSDSSLVYKDENEDPHINVEAASDLINTFSEWKGYNLPDLDPVFNKLWSTGPNEGIKTLVGPDDYMMIAPEENDPISLELKAKLGEGGRGRFRLKGGKYIVIDEGEGVYRIKGDYGLIGDSREEVIERMNDFLLAFGIKVKEQTLTAIYDRGMYHNGARVSIGGQFYTGGVDRLGNTNGLFGILYNRLIELVRNPDITLDENSASPLDETVVKSLASLDSRYRSDVGPSGYRDGGQSYYTVTAKKYVTDRMAELVREEDDMRDTLGKISFSKHSYLLNLLTDSEQVKKDIKEIRDKLQTDIPDEDRAELQQRLEETIRSTFKGKFGISHLGKTAIKQHGKKKTGDNSITAISEISHELTKLVMFEDMTQGSVTNSQGLKTYPGSTISIRMGRMFSPTMSDKDMMTILTTAILDLGYNELMANNGKMTDELVNVIYSQCVKPEIARMVSRSQQLTLGNKSNVKNYDEGAFQFYMLPLMNDVTYSGAKLTKLIQTTKGVTMDRIEQNPTIMKAINQTITEYVERLSNEKVAKWTNMDIIQYFDDTYKNNSKFQGTEEEINKQMAMDFVINSMITNANSFMLFAGDPALYYDGKGGINSTLVNIGKRLANQIAPGTAIANSENDQYVHLFLKDRKTISANIDYINRLYGEGSYESLQYSDIEASDAQEYTTWKEHLDVLSRLGKTNDYLLDISEDEIKDAYSLFESGKPVEKMSEKERQILTKVVQPMKPVYTGQLPDVSGDFMRVVYIKSSSFPLIPQLTKGLEIDKLRLKMEEIERNGMSVRASYGTANKVGAVTNPVTLWKADGTIDEKALENLQDASLILDRKNFRIQQDVPFKTEKNREDRVTLGTQMLKLLFGDEIIDMKGFMYKGEKMDGRKLYNEYTDTISKYIDVKKKQLFDELGLDELGDPVDSAKTFTKLQKLLQDEAEKRDYPLQSIEGLKLIDDGNGRYSFNLPLWINTESNRYESMLNSIVTKRLVQIKMPGASYVAGSPEGFIKTKKVGEEDIEEVLSPEERSQIIYTSAWNGNQLTGQMAKGKNGIKKAQVFVASKFRDANGDLIDLFQKKDGKYVYVKETEKGFELKEDMFDADVLSMFTFRTPSSGLQSATSVEIAGILPHTVGDLMIVPANFTKQKGMDFDVDKENGYAYWTHIGENGKIERLKESHRNGILNAADREFRQGKLAKLIKAYREANTTASKEYTRRKVQEYFNSQKLIKAMFPDGLNYTEEDFTDYEPEDDTKEARTVAKELSKSNKFLGKLNTQISEKVLQNDLVDIYHSVYSNPDPKIQRKINRVLNTQVAEDEAKYIQSLMGDRAEDGGRFATILSDEYQKSKLMSGSSGKTGTGAYSLDLVFHSLLQQAYKKGEANIALKEYVNPKDKTYQALRISFGRVKSEGVLGRHMTLGVDGKNGDRSITEGLSERQNMSVDNEKLQIMSKLGITKETMIVDKVLSLLGFDKGEGGHNISYLFLSQPVIRRFNELLRNANSVVAKYDPNVEEKILEQLGDEFEFDTLDMEAELSNLMSDTNMAKAIQNNGADGKLQAAILQRFINLRAYGYAIMKAQSALNFKGGSLGKSIFDVLDKKDNIAGITEIEAKNPAARQRLGFVDGLDRLVGTMGPAAAQEAADRVFNRSASGEDFETAFEDEKDKDMRAGTLYSLNGILIKPTTFMGKMNVVAASVSSKLWADYFPYENPTVISIFNELIPILGNGDNMSSTKKVELKQEIFRHLKKFINTMDNGIVHSTDNVNAERFRLMMDVGGNTSLSTYLKTVMDSDSPIVEHYLRSLKLLERLKCKKGDSIKPSTITYNNAAGEEYDEEYLYQTFNAMLTTRDANGKRVELPQVGNKRYTVDTLAQDLIAYAMLTSSTQQATEFVKYVPMAYLEAIGYTKFMRDLHNGFNIENNYVRVGMPDKDGNIDSVSTFSLQFLQHNPARVKYKMEMKSLLNKTLGLKYYKRSEGGGISSFESLESKETPNFISVYDPEVKGEKKFLLFMNDGTKYVRIPVLGAFGLDEYNARTNGLNSTILGLGTNKVEQFYPGRTIVQKDIKVEENSTDKFGINSNDIGTVLQNIINAKLGNMSALAIELAPHIQSISGIEYTDAFTDIYGEVQRNYDGIYDHNTNKIHISPTATAKMSGHDLASKILHETIHGITTKQMYKYIKSEGADGSVVLTDDAPIYVQNICRVYNHLRKAPARAQLIQAVREKVKNKQGLTPAEYNLYGLTNIRDFMTLSLTHKDFQQFMAGEKMPDGSNAFGRFLQFVKQMLEAIGLDFDKNTAAAQAIDSIMTFVKKENPTSTITPGEEASGEMWEEGGFKSNDEAEHRSSMDDDVPPFVPDFSPIIKGNKTSSKKGVSSVFKNNPQLSQIGTEEEYARYIDNIFPNSEIKDIVYHGTNAEFEEFDTSKGKWSNAIFFSFQEGDYKRKREIAAVVNATKQFNIDSYLDSKYGAGTVDTIINERYEGGDSNPEATAEYYNLYREEHPDTESSQFIKTETIKEYQKYGFDYMMPQEYLSVFDPKQVHILGSNKDLQDFKTWKEDMGETDHRRMVSDFNASIPKLEQGEIPAKKLTIREENCL